MHYENTPMQKYSDFCFHIQNENISGKDIFPIFAQNLGCGCTLEPVLTSTHNLCFGPKIRNKLYTPAYSVLPYKSRVEGGYSLHGHIS